MDKAKDQCNYTRTLQHFLKGYLYIITAYYLVEVVFLHPHTGILVYIIACILIGIQLGSVLVIHTIPVAYLKPIFTAYIHAIAIIIFYLLIDLGYHYTISPIVWFLDLILGVFILYPWKIAVRWFAYIFSLIVLASLLSYIMAHKNILIINFITGGHPAPITDPDYHYITVLVSMLFACLIFFYFLYYMHLFQELKVQTPAANTAESDKGMGELPSADYGKLKELYAQIEKYFESAQPYVNPDFTIIQLASALNTNTTYVSKAIKQESNVNFSVYINQYRVDKIKKMLQDKSNKYTLEYVATACGFRHQSTFNKTFKQIEGTTPSEFCKNQAK
jgi:AraC-like DNA-binding protein